MDKAKTVCVFGDSTAWGAWDMEKGGWVKRLWFYLAEKESDVVLYNLSIEGGTSQLILDRFEREAKTRKADALIFQPGGNDVAYKSTEDNPWIPIQQFENNLKEIIERSKAITDKVLLLGIDNVDETRTMPVSWEDTYYSNANIQKYNEKFKNICKEHGVSFIDFFGIYTENDLDDGLHPNASGHKKVFAKVKKFLEREDWI